MATPHELGAQAAWEKFAGKDVKFPLNLGRPPMPAEPVLHSTPAPLHNVNEPPGSTPAAPLLPQKPASGGLPLGAMLAGGALGEIFGPDDAKTQSAMLGAAGGLGLAHMAHVGANGVRGGVSALHAKLTGGGGAPPHTPTPAPGGSGPHSSPSSPNFEEELHRANAMNHVSPVHQSAAAPAGSAAPPPAPAPNPHEKIPPRAAPPPSELQASLAGTALGQKSAPAPMGLDQHLEHLEGKYPATSPVLAEAKARRAQEAHNVWQKHFPEGIPPAHQAQYAADLERAYSKNDSGAPGLASLGKVAADMGFTQSVALPGGASIGMSSMDRSDRLPGMHRWVPRSVLERVFADVDQGMPDEAILDAEGNRGEVTDPALGGGLGAMLARGAFPKGGWLPPAVGGVAGAAVGSGLHHLGRPKREENASEAIKGVRGETEGKRPIFETAKAPTPLTVSGGVLDA